MVLYMNYVLRNIAISGTLLLGLYAAVVHAKPTKTEYRMAQEDMRITEWYIIHARRNVLK